MQHLCCVPCGGAEPRLAKVILLDLLRSKARNQCCFMAQVQFLFQRWLTLLSNVCSYGCASASPPQHREPTAGTGHTEYHDLTAAASPCQLLLRYRFSPYAWLPLCLNTQRAAQLCANAAAWQPRSTIRQKCGAVMQSVHQAAQLYSNRSAWHLGPVRLLVHASPL